MDGPSPASFTYKGLPHGLSLFLSLQHNKWLRKLSRGSETKTLKIQNSKQWFVPTPPDWHKTCPFFVKEVKTVESRQEEEQFQFPFIVSSLPAWESSSFGGERAKQSKAQKICLWPAPWGIIQTFRFAGISGNCRKISAIIVRFHRRSGEILHNIYGQGQGPETGNVKAGRL